MRKCTIENCGRPHESRGLCNMHYMRLRKHGDPLGGTSPHAPAGEPLRWLQRHAKHASDECLIWPFALNRHGYGNLWIDGKSRRASRVMCEIVNGPPPSPDHDAAHSCGRGQHGCVSPTHLSWKTKAENCADKITHGTHLQGDLLPQAKLNAEQVREIRASRGVFQRDLAKKYCVSRPTISEIINRRTWRHIA